MGGRRIDEVARLVGVIQPQKVLSFLAGVAHNDVGTTIAIGVADIEGVPLAPLG